MANLDEFDWPAKPSVLGTRVNRVDGPDKVTGRAKYTFDINRPRMLYARMVRSPHPHARVVSVDLSAATRMPGVKAVAPRARLFRCAEQSRDVPGRRGGGRSRRYRRTRHRCGAGDQSRVRGSAALDHRRESAGRDGSAGVHGRKRARWPARASGRSDGGLRGGGERGRRRPIRPRSSRTPAWRRMARYANGMATG